MNLLEKPFNLKKEELTWVEETLASMTLEEKIGQLFVPIGYSTEQGYIDSLLHYKIGGLFFRSGSFTEMKDTLTYAQEKSRIPLLTPANLEYGGNGAITEGTAYGTPMAIAATNNPENAYRLGNIAASEASEVGVNWAFAPVVDLDLEFHNPITNVRTYGDDVHKVIDNARSYIKGCQEKNVLTSIKHFPGDGVDERDQHLLTSVNSLPFSAWKKSYGKIYQTLIDEGAKAVMVGHIAFPAYSGNEMPASLSEPLLQGLLRKELGFDGLVITDASPMVGFTVAMNRREAVPACIQRGCDMLLFNKDFEEDVFYMKEGLKNGLLSEDRLEEAVTRILATKASMGLHRGVLIGDKSPDYTKEQVALANQAITLVQDKQNLLPLKTGARVLVELLGTSSSNEHVKQHFVSELEKLGFTVTVYQKETNFYELETVESFKSKYDYVIYVANIENASNQTTARINWHTLYGLGNNLPWFVQEVPTLLVSFGNPYHYFDVPMIPTIINCYCNYDHFITAAVSKICGKDSFKGTSPIDPWCRNQKLKEWMKDETN